MAGTEIIPYVFYRDVSAAMQFLDAALGFHAEMRHATPSGGVHAQMVLDGQRVMIGQAADASSCGPPGAGGRPTMGVFIYVADVDATHARAIGAGAAVDGAPVDHGYGRTFTVKDPEGHPWYVCERSAA